MPIPVVNIAQMRDWERATWATGRTEADVIRRVGKRVAKRARNLTRTRDTILILAGKGHNGDDVRAAAEYLEDRKSELLNIGSPEADLSRVELSLRLKPALIIDGLFGIGLNRPLDDAWKILFDLVIKSQIPVLSVDVPSGLNADTGANFGAAIEAAVTLTVGAPKIGLLALAASPFVGRLEVLDDIGLISCPHKSELNWTHPDDFENFPPRRAAAGHKGAFGHLAVIAGSFGFHGAAVLAVRAAQRAQLGLVTLFTRDDVYHAAAGQLQSAMVNLWKPELKFHDGISALLIGPGLAAPDLPEEMKSNLRRLWRDFHGPIVVDASALDWVPMAPPAKNSIRILTPHPGEAARLLSGATAQVQADRAHALREISRRFGNCWVVLKGLHTLVGRAEGEIFVNPSGNPHLAQGGSGDTLAGFIAGLFAQPMLQADICRTLRYAVWQHGAAADVLQARRRNWTVEDLVEELGR
jgi:NAD(P)H-hydrate epimerase